MVEFKLNFFISCHSAIPAVPTVRRKSLCTRTLSCEISRLTTIDPVTHERRENLQNLLFGVLTFCRAGLIFEYKSNFPVFKMSNNLPHISFSAAIGSVCCCSSVTLDWKRDEVKRADGNEKKVRSILCVFLRRCSISSLSWAKRAWVVEILYKKCINEQTHCRYFIEIVIQFSVRAMRKKLIFFTVRISIVGPIEWKYFYSCCCRATMDGWMKFDEPPEKTKSVFVLQSISKIVLFFMNWYLFMIEDALTCNKKSNRELVSQIIKKGPWEAESGSFLSGFWFFVLILSLHSSRVVRRERECAGSRTKN